ncbi:MAG: MotA/TolQ/ExbB proton channel family protein [Limnohabitans sp.]|jgi:biopolymer transport protein ExbB|nr:MotA/TolQ/ExbB proton channel family protein [Limnohabitans sp.]
MNALLPNILLQAAASGTSSASSGGSSGGSMLKFITGGGPIGYVIVLLSLVAFAFVVIHFVQIRRSALLPEERVRAVKEIVERGDLEGALEYAALPANDCYYLRVVGAGIKRFLRSPFGAFEIKSAMEEAGAEETARLYRTMDVIATIGSVAPLLGLLGTVQGMIGAFDTVAMGSANNASYYETLAANIAIALITTFQGLVVAIPCVSIYGYLRNRVDALAGECAANAEEIVALIEKSARKSTK